MADPADVWGCNWGIPMKINLRAADVRMSRIVIELKIH